MCRDLYKAGYSFETIQSLHNAAQKYGQPDEVFRAISKFGSHKAIDAETMKGQRQLEELQQNIQDAKGSYTAFNDLVLDFINLLGEKSKEGMENVTKLSAESISKIKAEADEYAKRLADAEIFEKELGMARVILSVKNYPIEAAKLPPDYIIQILRGIINVLRVKALNPTINVAFEFGARKVSFQQPPVIDVLTICSQVLESEMRF